MTRPHDGAEIVRLYVEERLTTAEVAETIGCHRSAVYRHLNAAGIERRDDRLRENRTPATRCQRDLHDLNEENTRVDKKGGRHCRACERTYATIYHYAKRAAQN